MPHYRIEFTQVASFTIEASSRTALEAHLNSADSTEIEEIVSNLGSFEPWQHTVIGDLPHDPEREVECGLVETKEERLIVDHSDYKLVMEAKG